MTPKKERFIVEYLIDLNATKAAERAGYSARTAYSAGQRLLKDVEVATALTKAQQERAQRTGVTADRVLLELAAIGFSDLRDVFDEHGHLRPPQDLPDTVASAIASVKVTKERSRREGDTSTEETVTEVKAWDKPRALEMMGRHLGMFVDRQQHEGSFSVDVTGSVERLTSTLARIAARAAGRVVGGTE